MVRQVWRGQRSAQICSPTHFCMGVGMAGWTPQERAPDLPFARPHSPSRRPGGGDQSLKSLDPKPTDSVKAGNLQNQALESGLGV